MAEPDYKHSPDEDNSPEEDGLAQKALCAADAVRAILEMLGNPDAAEFVLADVAGQHLATYCEEHRADVRQRLIADIDGWTERYAAENDEADEEEPRKLDS